METYVIQTNRDGGYTVFDKGAKWVGVFQEYSHASKFIRLVLQGVIDDGY